jgi:hypothetical protein
MQQRLQAKAERIGFDRKIPSFLKKMAMERAPSILLGK